MEILDIVSVNLLMQFVVVDGSWDMGGIQTAENGVEMHELPLRFL